MACSGGGAVASGAADSRRVRGLQNCTRWDIGGWQAVNPLAECWSSRGATKRAENHWCSTAIICHMLRCERGLLISLCFVMQAASAVEPSCTKKCVKYDPKFCVAKEVKC